MHMARLCFGHKFTGSTKCVNKIPFSSAAPSGAVGCRKGRPRSALPVYPQQSRPGVLFPPRWLGQGGGCGLVGGGVEFGPPGHLRGPPAGPVIREVTARPPPAQAQFPRRKGYRESKSRSKLPHLIWPGMPRGCARRNAHNCFTPFFLC